MRQVQTRRTPKKTLRWGTGIYARNPTSISAWDAENTDPVLSSSSVSTITSPCSTARLIVLKIFSAAKYLPWRRRRSYYAKEPVINLFVNGDEEHIAALLGDVIGCVTLAANCWGPIIPSNPKRPQLDSSKKPRRYSEKPGSFGQFRSTMTYNGDGRWERRDSWGHQSVARPDPIPKTGKSWPATWSIPIFFHSWSLAWHLKWLPWLPNWCRWGVSSTTCATTATGSDPKAAVQLVNPNRSRLAKPDLATLNARLNVFVQNHSDWPNCSTSTKTSTNRCSGWP